MPRVQPKKDKKKKKERKEKKRKGYGGCFMDDYSGIIVMMIAKP